MDKTVVIVCGNALSALSGGAQILLDLKVGGKHGSGPKTIVKTLWTSCVEAVIEYCRIIFDLFPDQYQVCVAAADEMKCHPINTWRDEDQELTKVQGGFQKFGFPVLSSSSAPHARSHMTSILQGLQFGMRCLAQLTATQYAVSLSLGPMRKPPVNQGRIILFCCLNGQSDLKEIEKTAVNLLRVENADIKQKHDPARLPIQRCEVVIVNSHVSGTHCDILDTPSHSVLNDLSMAVYSYPANQLIGKTIDLVKMHFALRSSIVTNIPMKEEQSGGGSFNYDVELIHKEDAHRDIFRAGYQHTSQTNSTDSTKEMVMLRWSTPKSLSLDLQYCSSLYRVTPVDVTSRPTICLINFVLSGKPVLLEQPRKNTSTKLITHLLCCRGGAIFLHCLPGGRSHLDESPSISEGWGGRITDYRISDFSLLVNDNMLVPYPVERTKIPSIYPIQMAKSNLERMTRHWPLVFSDTVAYSMTQELEPLLSVIHHLALSEIELESCKKIITTLQYKEENNDPLPIPSSGTRTRGSAKRDEQYHLLWNELEAISGKYCGLSEQHRMLYEFISHAASQSPSSQSIKSTHDKKDDIHIQELVKKVQEEDCGSESIHMSRSKGLRNAPYPIPAKPVASLLSIWTTQLNAKASAGHPEFKGRITCQSNRAELYTFMKSGSDSEYRRAKFYEILLKGTTSPKNACNYYKGIKFSKEFMKYRNAV